MSGRQVQLYFVGWFDKIRRVEAGERVCRFALSQALLRPLMAYYAGHMNNRQNWRARIRMQLRVYTIIGSA